MEVHVLCRHVTRASHPEAVTVRSLPNTVGCQAWLSCGRPRVLLLEVEEATLGTVQRETVVVVVVVVTHSRAQVCGNFMICCCCCHLAPPTHLPAHNTKETS